MKRGDKVWVLGGGGSISAHVGEYQSPLENTMAHVFYRGRIRWTFNKQIVASRSEAIAKLEVARSKKIASLEKQIARLRSLDPEKVVPE
jgi:hypothetical protein